MITLGQQVEDLRVGGGLAVPGEPGRQAPGLPNAVLQGLQVRRGHPRAGRAGGQRAPPDQFVVHTILLLVIPSVLVSSPVAAFAPVVCPGAALVRHGCWPGGVPAWRGFGSGARVRGFGGEPGGSGDRFISNCIARAPETFTHDQKETQA